MAITKFSNLTYGNYADYVHCNNCNCDMIVPIGTDICPKCGVNGCLAWVNEDNEVNVNEFAKTHDINETIANYIDVNIF